MLQRRRHDRLAVQLSMRLMILFLFLLSASFGPGSLSVSCLLQREAQSISISGSLELGFRPRSVGCWWLRRGFNIAWPDGQRVEQAVFFATLCSAQGSHPPAVFRDGKGASTRQPQQGINTAKTSSSNSNQQAEGARSPFQDLLRPVSAHVVPACRGRVLPQDPHSSGTYPSHSCFYERLPGVNTGNGRVASEPGRVIYSSSRPMAGEPGPCAQGCGLPSY
jgi:hypothetical protein